MEPLELDLAFAREPWEAVAGSLAPLEDGRNLARMLEWRAP